MKNTDRAPSLPSIVTAGNGFFASLHPAVTAVYFLTVTVLLMFLSHPAVTAAALVGGGALYGELLGRRRLLRGLPALAGLILLVTLTNPLFSDTGKTVLFSLSVASLSRTVTEEALAYGANLAGTLAAMLLWFVCFGALMSADKWVFLLGRLAPRLSMTLVISLRNLPLFFRHWQRVREAQRGIGYLAGKNRARREIRTFSALFSWALENAADTAASMEARGYGLPGRSRFALYRFTRRDVGTLALCLSDVAGAFISLGTGGLAYSFYPTLSPFLTGWTSLLGYGAFLLLTCYPALRERGEAMLWQSLQSKI